MLLRVSSMHTVERVYGTALRRAATPRYTFAKSSVSVDTIVWLTKVTVLRVTESVTGAAQPRLSC
jgi:hypothetical protein